MERLIQQLTKAGISFNSETIRQEVLSLGFNPEDLSVEDVNLIVEEFKTRSSLSTVQQKQQTKPESKLDSKQTNNKNGAKIQQRPTRTSKRSEQAIQQSLNHAAAQSKLEIGAFVDHLQQGANHFSEQAAVDALEIIRGIPNQMLDRFVQIAGEEKADPDRFRAIAQDYVSSIFNVE
jgi:hypothetical protein